MQKNKQSIQAVLTYIRKHMTALYCIAAMCVGMTTLLPKYDSQPGKLVWDEVYYITAVEKYKQGVFFMESHPPLGKLLMTIGEVLIDPNRDIDLTGVVLFDAVNSDENSTQDNLPDNYSFLGIRLVPILFSIGTVGILFAILFTITRNRFLSFGFASLLAIDNAWIVHSRAAMVDSIMVFFMLCAVLFAIRVIQKKLQHTKSISKLDYVALFTSIGLAISTKYNAVFLLALIPIVVCIDAFIGGNSKKTHTFHTSIQAWKKIVFTTFAGIATVVLIFVSVFYVHYSLAHSVNSGGKNNSGYYGASDELKARLGKPLDPYTFALALRDGVQYTFKYHSGVISFQECEKNARKEGQFCNGSLPWMWPFMSRTISYRWDRAVYENNKLASIDYDSYNRLESEEKKKYEVMTGYVTLVGNPVVWGVALFGILFSLAYIVQRIVHRHTIRECIPAIVLLIMYFGYLCYASFSTRILYLYHYFFALTVAIILSGFALSVWIKKRQGTIDTSTSLLLVIAAITFFLFSPFTYGFLVNEKYFDMVNAAKWWFLKS